MDGVRGDGPNAEHRLSIHEIKITARGGSSVLDEKERNWVEDELYFVPLGPYTDTEECGTIIVKRCVQ